MAPLVRALLKKRKGAQWEKLSSQWFTTKFLGLLAGLVDISDTLKRAEKSLQDHTISFTTRDSIMQKMRDQLREPMGSRPTFSSVRANLKKGADGRMTYKGVGVLDNGGAAPMLKTIREVILSQFKSRMAGRGILHRLGWLDLSTWPENGPELGAFALGDIEAVHQHWRKRLAKRSVTLEGLKAELDMVKTIWQTTAKPVTDSYDFWRRIIRNRGPFPQMHVFLRMCLALCPVDTVVESAFSRLTRILCDQRLAIGTEFLEQLLILAVDSTRWEDYDYSEVIQLIRDNGRRQPFRRARADAGEKRGKKRKRSSSRHVRADPLLGVEVGSSSSSSSSSDSDSATSDE